MSTYTQVYSNFLGADVSSDPKAIARNRLTECVNMWRDYDSEQGEAIETFPGFRAVTQQLSGGKSVHGMYHFKSKSGDDYVVVHAGTDLYSFNAEDLASGDFSETASPILSGKLTDQSSTGFIYNNNLYILDGTNYIVVTSVTDGATTSITAKEVDAYIPTTYFDGKPYEQRNMLSKYAYEVASQSTLGSSSSLEYVYADIESSDRLIPSRRIVKGLTNREANTNILCISASDKTVKIVEGAFENMESIEILEIECKGELNIQSGAFKNCRGLSQIRICINEPIEYHPYQISMEADSFEGCSLMTIELYSTFANLSQNLTDELDDDIFEYYTIGEFLPSKQLYNKSAKIADLATDVEGVCDRNTGAPIDYTMVKASVTISGETVSKVSFVCVSDKDFGDGVKIKLKLHPNHYSTIENVKSFLDGNTDYRKTGLEAINGCRKSAVYDGRIFLTGNPDLPNTVFYSNRNNTGANDPTYFGAYNYFNDGVGNTPNVELLATPSMLMVLKNNTVQDASIYYHQGAYNTDEFSKDLVPRIYPSVAGAAGIGSAGKIDGGVTCCNFLDDPVFLTQRGLDAVGKETVNLERTVMHRSSNVDRLLKKENMANASLAEWKGYLVVMIDGHAYLADSRRMFQHDDGSYQYEWFYLDDLGVYSDYVGRYKYLKSWPTVVGGKHGNTVKSLGDCFDREYTSAKDKYQLYDSDHVYTNSEIRQDYVYIDLESAPLDMYYVEENGEKFAVINEDNEQMPTARADFCPACRVLAVGDYLFFGTTNGTLCIINTDKRDGTTDRIPRDYYTHNGIAYTSGCATRLDDCDKKSVAKMTVCGTSIMNLKTLDGARCTVNISINGRDWRRLKVVEASGSVFSFDDMDFSNFSFTENEVNIVKLPELTRNWVHKQYYVYSDGFKEPFGLYSLSYIYKDKGKIRRI